MPQIIVDPAEMRRFANAVDRLREKLQAKRANVMRKHESLKETWKDAKYQSFDKVFTNTLEDLDQFIKKTAEYSAYLRKKAAKAEKYLSR